MELHLGKLVEKVAKSKGYSQQTLGNKINLSKPGVASMYKKKHINTDVLLKLTEELDFDFISPLYEYEILKKFKELELATLIHRIKVLDEQNEALTAIVSRNDHIIELQTKLILELEDKIKRLTSED